MLLQSSPQWGAADAEIKVPSGENTELKRSPFKVWSRSVHSYTCYAYCHEFLPRLFLPFRSIHLHFFQNLSQFFPVLAVANTGSCVGPQNKISHPVGCRFLCWVPAESKQAKKTTITHILEPIHIPRALIRTPASSRVTYFILRAYTGAGVSDSYYRKNSGEVLEKMQMNGPEG